MDRVVNSVVKSNFQMWLLVWTSTQLTNDVRLDPFLLKNYFKENHKDSWRSEDLIKR